VACCRGVVERDERLIRAVAAPDGKDSGETWAAPVEDAYLLRLTEAAGRTCTSVNNNIYIYLGVSATYLAITGQNIRHPDHRIHRRINGLLVFWIPAENPRVGGSIPPWPP
jgi:hypothetical protein